MRRQNLDGPTLFKYEGLNYTVKQPEIGASLKEPDKPKSPESPKRKSPRSPKKKKSEDLSPIKSPKKLKRKVTRRDSLINLQEAGGNEKEL